MLLLQRPFAVVPSLRGCTGTEGRALRREAGDGNAQEGKGGSPSDPVPAGGAGLSLCRNCEIFVISGDSPPAPAHDMIE